MMRIYLVQHGEATSEEIDPARPLTQKGREDVERVAGFIGGLHIPSIIHSGKTRAFQTAEILSQAVIPKVEPVQRDGLLPNDPVEPIYRELMNLEEDVMVVGHLPFLSRLASMLLVGSTEEEIIRFQMGGVVCLVREDGRFKIKWMVTPDILR